jgi:hypothetical protein
MTYSVYMIRKGKHVKVQGNLQSRKAKKCCLMMTEACTVWDCTFYIKKGF